MSKFFLAALTVLFLSGCSTYYKHPSKPNHLFDSDNAECRRSHTSKQCTTTNPTSNTECKKDPIWDKVSCTTVHIPAVTTCRDQVSSRDVSNCLAFKGWYRTDKDGNRK